ncbi:hypothetical protein [Dongshaea marina]|uniref:hypothetical protein n=1 Tax=Dongshaea marina TaxID=2047966 RepID=UPI00131F14A5|nr:hypothetical protein [Dongshaea marina]
MDHCIGYEANSWMLWQRYSESLTDAELSSAVESQLTLTNYLSSGLNGELVISGSGALEIIKLA